MDLDFDPLVVVVTLVFWIVVLLIIWKVSLFGSSWGLKSKIILSVFSLPMFYFAVSYQLNK